MVLLEEVKMTPTNQPESDKELRQYLIEKYMEVAASFYYEGSDKETEQSEYAPKFADEIIKFLEPRIAAECQAALEQLRKRIRSDWKQPEIGKATTALNHYKESVNKIIDEEIALRSASRKEDE